MSQENGTRLARYLRAKLLSEHMARRRAGSVRYGLQDPADWLVLALAIVIAVLAWWFVAR